MYIRRRIVGCRLPGTGVYVYIVAESDDVISELKTELTQDSRNALSAGSAVTQNLEIPRNWEQNETTFYYVITFSHEFWYFFMQQFSDCTLYVYSR